MKPKIPFFKQETCWTCGPAVIKMFLASIGIKKSEKQLTKILKANKIVGTRQISFVNFAQKYGFKYLIGTDVDISLLKSLLDKNYFIIVSFLKNVTDDPRYPFKLRKNFAMEEHHLAVLWKISNGKVYLLDPSFGEDESHPIEHFVKMWSKPNYFEKTRRWFFALKK